MGDRETSLIERRRIEALTAVPLIKGYILAWGRDRALDLAIRTIQDLTRKAGRQAAAELRTNSIGELARIMRSWAAGGVAHLEAS